MLEDAEELARLLCDQRGVFYLCGPTWPVADVHDTLIEALMNHGVKERQAAMTYLEYLKGEDRYVLEVY